MKLSTRGRYGMRVMTDLALNSEKGWVTVRDISRRQMISPVYLEQLLTQLRAAGLVKSSAGPKGGFIMAKSPAKTTLKEILEAVERTIVLVDCTRDPSVCSRSAVCLTRELWLTINRAIDKALSSSLQDLIDGRLTLVKDC